MLHNLRFFSSKCRLFHNGTFFGSCIIHILNTGVLKFKRKFRRQRVKYVSPSSGTRNKKTFDDRLEVDVPSASSGRDTIYKHGVFRGPLFGVVPTLLRNLVSFFIVLVTQLQLCHILWLDSLQSMDELHLQISYL